MRKLIPLALAGGLLLGGGPRTPAAAEAAATPSWLKADAAARKVLLDVVAAFNENNSNWNFNGYHNGGATITVPLGWTVQVPFHNQEEEIPHSLVVIADSGDQEKYPTEASADAAAFPGAHTASPVEGTAKGQDATFSFSAAKPGDYLL